MTNSQVRKELNSKGIYLADITRHKFTHPFISVPLEAYEMRIIDFINGHPDLTPDEKESFITEFVNSFAIKVVEEAEGIINEMVYNELTFKELAILMANESSTYYLISDPKIKFKLVEVPLYYNFEGKRKRFEKIGKGFDPPFFTYEVHGNAFKQFLST